MDNARRRSAPFPSRQAFAPQDALASTVCAPGRDEDAKSMAPRPSGVTLPDRFLIEGVAQIVGDENRHPRFIDVRGIPHDVDTRKLGERGARQARSDLS